MKSVAGKALLKRGGQKSMYAGLDVINGHSWRLSDSFIPSVKHEGDQILGIQNYTPHRRLEEI